MNYLIHMLTIIFLIMIFYHIFIYFMGGYKEGLTNNTTSDSSTFIPYDPNVPSSPNSANNAALTLAQHNAQNITYLNNKFSNILSMQKEVADISMNVVSLNQQVAGLMKQQTGYISSIGSNGKPNLTKATQQENAFAASNSQ
jgi:hypothetical protein